MNNLIALHETAMYFVRTDIIDENTIEVSYPSNVLIENPISKSYVRYVLGEGTVTKMTLSENGDIIDQITVKSPDYAKRLVIMADVMVYCDVLGISSELVFKYKDGVRLNDDEGIIASLTKPEERYPESVLFNIFSSMNIRRDCAQLAEANEVLEGYNLLLTIVEMRGL